MRKESLLLTIFMIGVLAVTILVGIFFNSTGVNSNSSSTPIPTIMPSKTMTSTPTSTPTATTNSKLTVTYSELSRNQTMIVIQFKLEPNSYIFQWNATSFYLIEGAVRISANINDVVIIGTQYSTLFFPIGNYQGTDYQLSSDKLPIDTIWIRQ
jgi:hypothetical protein